MRVSFTTLLISSLLFLVSCHSGNIRYRQVDAIVFYPMPKKVERPYAITSFFGLRLETRDTSITDRKRIKEFCHLLNCLEAEKELGYIDIRCAAVLKMKSGRDQCFCFGYTTGIQHNGCMSMKDYQPIFDFIENQIYATQPPDYWYDDDTKELIKWVHDELLPRNY